MVFWQSKYFFTTWTVPCSGPCSRERGNGLKIAIRGNYLPVYQKTYTKRKKPQQNKRYWIETQRLFATITVSSVAWLRYCSHSKWPHFFCNQIKSGHSLSNSHPCMHILEVQNRYPWNRMWRGWKRSCPKVSQPFPLSPQPLNAPDPNTFHTATEPLWFISFPSTQHLKTSSK